MAAISTGSADQLFILPILINLHHIQFHNYSKEKRVNVSLQFAAKSTHRQALFDLEKRLNILIERTVTDCYGDGN